MLSMKALKDVTLLSNSELESDNLIAEEIIRNDTTDEDLEYLEMYFTFLPLIRGQKLVNRLKDLDKNEM